MITIVEIERIESLPKLEQSLKQYVVRKHLFGEAFVRKGSSVRYGMTRHRCQCVTPTFPMDYWAAIGWSKVSATMATHWTMRLAKSRTECQEDGSVSECHSAKFNCQCWITMSSWKGESLERTCCTGSCTTSYVQQFAGILQPQYGTCFTRTCDVDMLATTRQLQLVDTYVFRFYWVL